MIHVITRAEALRRAPLHEDRLRLGADIQKVTGSFPWGVANPEDPAQLAWLSAAILLASQHRVREGLPPLLDVMGPWETRERLRIREPIGPSINLAAVTREPPGMGWMVTRMPLGTPPFRGPECGAEGEALADATVMEQHYGILVGDSLHYTAP